MEAGDQFQNALKVAYRAALIATDALYLFGDRPEVLKLPGGGYRLYYAGSNIPDSEAEFQIGLAESDDGIAWTRHPGNPVPRLDPASDEVSLLGQSVVSKDGESWMWYAVLSKESKVEIRFVVKISPSCFVYEKPTGRSETRPSAVECR
jgi:hypothetical protein